MQKPQWATHKVRCHLATCWFAEEEENGCLMEGVHWWDDWLLSFSTTFHNCFVAPFCDYGFPIKILEEYTD